MIHIALFLERMHKSPNSLKTERTDQYAIALVGLNRKSGLVVCMYLVLYVLPPRGISPRVGVQFVNPSFYHRNDAHAPEWSTSFRGWSLNPPPVDSGSAGIGPRALSADPDDPCPAFRGHFSRPRATQGRYGVI